MDSGFFSSMAVPTLLAAAALLVLGVAVLVRERCSAAASLFFVINLSAAIWLLSMTMVYSSPAAPQALRWARAAFLGTSLLPAAIHHFTALVVGVASRRRGLIVAGWTCALAFAFSGSATGIFAGGVAWHSWGWYPTFTPLASLFVMYFAAFLSLTLVYFVAARRRSPAKVERERTQALFLAFSVSYFALIDFLPAFGIPMYPAGYVPVALFLALSARAIWRYGLVDITASFAAANILETMQGAVVVTDLEGRIRLVNASFCRMIERTDSELLDRPLRSILTVPERASSMSDSLIRGRNIRDRSMTWRRSDGEPVEVAVSASLLRDERGRTCGMVYVAMDTADRRRAEELERRAFHDPLTQLPNREFFRNRLEEALASLDDSSHLAVLFVDLDGFKRVNDTWGHEAGDRVLREVAARMAGTLRENDLIARHGGDEFTVLLEVARREYAEAVASKIRSAVERGSRAVTAGVSASIGIALAPDDAADAETLIRKADAAMYSAKQSRSVPRTDLEVPHLQQHATEEAVTPPPSRSRTDEPRPRTSV